MKNLSLKCLFAAALAATPLSTLAQQGDRQGHDMKPPPADLQIPSAEPKTVEQSLADFQIVDGFEIQIVASEPLIEDPVVVSWDADGRMWVCEMKGYMPDIDGNGEDEPSGNIVILEDTDQDGKMDKRTVFLDNIVLPRAIAHVKGGILYADQTTLYFVGIENGNEPGIKQVVDPNYPGNGGNVEHKPNGLMYGLDNWYYSAKSNTRYTRVGVRFMRKDSEHRGQWGITQDDYGRLLTNTNSNLMIYEMLPPNATLANPNFNFKAGRDSTISVNNSVYPIRVTPGVNRGYQPSVVDHETWKLKNATAASGPEIYRADAYPEEFYNNVFIPEPAGHLLKRVIIEDNGMDKPTARQAYDDHEFLASTDERCRFVNVHMGPDGCLYVVDMYRGIVQHKTYVTTFLRRQILERGLDKPIGMGRIYRIVYTGNKDNAVAQEGGQSEFVSADASGYQPVQPNLSEASSSELVQNLAHANAWWRLTSQRLLVERRDSEVVGDLEKMATSHSNTLARIHALWTLKGMRKLEVETLIAAGKSDMPKVWVQVLRLSEDFDDDEKAGELVDLMVGYLEHPSYELDLQLALSAGTLAGIDHPEAYDVLLTLAKRHQGNGLIRQAVVSGLEGKEAVMLQMVRDQAGDAKLDALTKDLAGAMMKATERGTLTIGAILTMVDSEDFRDQPEQRLSMLNMLATQAIEQDRNDVLDELFKRLASEGATLEEQKAIMTGLTEAEKPGNQLVDLDGKPEIFVKWQEKAPEGLEELVAKIDDTFMFEQVKLTEDQQAQLNRGLILYAQQCMTCHGPNGEGVQTQAPPLAGSEWVHMSEEAVVHLLLGGIEGPIVVNGQLYEPPAIQPSMPGFAPGMKDDEIADVLTYVRGAFGNRASPISTELVASIRPEVEQRNNQPYSTIEIIKIDDPEGTTPEVAKVEASLLNLSWGDMKAVGMLVLFGSVTVPLVLLLVGTAVINKSGQAA